MPKEANCPSLAKLWKRILRSLHKLVTVCPQQIWTGGDILKGWEQTLNGHDSPPCEVTQASEILCTTTTTLFQKIGPQCKSFNKDASISSFESLIYFWKIWPGEHCGSMPLWSLFLRHWSQISTVNRSLHACLFSQHVHKHECFILFNLVSWIGFCDFCSNKTKTPIHASENGVYILTLLASSFSFCAV